MNLLTRIILCAVHAFPRVAARTHAPDGRRKPTLRALLVLLGAACAAAGWRAGAFALRGFNDGSLGTVVAVLVAAGAVLLLFNGGACIARGARNPAPPALPDNVIPMQRARGAPQSTGTTGA